MAAYLSAVLFEGAQMKALFEFETLLLPEVLDFVFRLAQVLHGFSDLVDLVKVITVQLVAITRRRVARVPRGATRRQHDLLD